MSKISYKNKYGYLELEPIQYKNIRSIFSKDLAHTIFFSIEVGEQIALITDNKNIQLSVNYKFKKMFLIHHTASNIGAVCKITKLYFDNKINPQKEIEKLAVKVLENKI